MGAKDSPKSNKRFLPHNKKNDENLMEASEFMVEYRLCEGLFLEKDVSLIQPTIITFN